METKRKKIILVDDNAANLLTGKNALMEEYDVYTLASGEKLFNLLQKISLPDLILLDIEMPGMNGYEVIDVLKKDPITAEIPVIFLTSWSDPGTEIDGLNLGAVDYISKPFSPPLLLKRIENHLTMSSQKKELQDFNKNLIKMVKEKTGQVVELQNAILNTVAELVEFRDSTTGGHIERTQSYLQLLVDKVYKENLYGEEVSGWNLEFLIPSAQLHDVGKIGISDTILNKPGKLTIDEFEIMKKHAIIGEEAIDSIMKMSKKNDFLRHAKIFAGTHHEKWNGTGYPRGLKGAEIPLQGRIMAIADVYDALIAHRPYKAPLGIAESKEILLKGSETHFDPELIELFQDLAPEFEAIAENRNSVLEGSAGE
jgi:putative two-component system response regulator